MLSTRLAHTQNCTTFNLNYSVEQKCSQLDWGISQRTANTNEQMETMCVWLGKLYHRVSSSHFPVADITTCGSHGRRPGWLPPCCWPYYLHLRERHIAQLWASDTHQPGSRMRMSSSHICTVLLRQCKITETSVDNKLQVALSWHGEIAFCVCLPQSDYQARQDIKKYLYNQYNTGHLKWYRHLPRNLIFQERQNQYLNLPVCSNCTI